MQGVSALIKFKLEHIFYIETNGGLWEIFRKMKFLENLGRGGEFTTATFHHCLKKLIPQDENIK
jgi:hypothetical protein